jgi:hypothetical protein
MKLTLSMVTMGIVMGLTMLTATSSFAAVARVYVGSQCSYQNATSPNDASHAINNTTGVAQVTTCPVSKDGLADANDISFAAAYVSGAVLSCRLEMRQATGGVVGWNHYRIINLGGGNSRFEWFGPGNAPGNYDPNAGLAIACTLPANTSLWLYQLNEL